MSDSGGMPPDTNYPSEFPGELGQSLADRLAKSLKYANLSHIDMAEYLEVHRNTIGGYVTGKTKMLPGIMRLWAAKTGLPLEWIRDGVWPDPPKKTAARGAVRGPGRPTKGSASRAVTGRRK